MGNFILKREEQLFTEMIDDRNVRISRDYTKFFKGKPTFVTYYQQNKDSTREKTLETEVGIFGPDSPIKFNRIETFPLYSLEGLESIDENSTEFGPDIINSGSAIVIPGLVIPIELDHFTISHEKNKYLYRINKVSRDSKRNLGFYKIEFELIHNSPEEAETQVTKEFITDYDNIGTEYRAIVETSDRTLVNTIDNIYFNIMQYVKRYCYNVACNIFIGEFNPPSSENIINVYDPLLHKFYADTELFMPINKKYILNAILISEVDLTKAIYKTLVDKQYKNSIYWAMENKEVKNYVLHKIGFINNPNPSNELNFVKGISYSITNYEGDSYDLFDETFITHLRDKTYYGTEDKVVDDIILMYLNKALNKNNILEKIYDISFDTEYIDLIKASLILFIIKDFQKQLIKL